MTKTARIYRLANGSAPYEEWLQHLKDVVGRAKIKVRVDRLIRGNFGDHRSVGAGIVELRVAYGPGYRVYVGQQGDHIVVLLCGGDKGSQSKDIARAHAYWNDYKRRL